MSVRGGAGRKGWKAEGREGRLLLL